MWMSITIGVVIVAALIVVVLRRSSRSPSSELSSEQWIAIGISFMAIGAGTIPTLGNVMIVMIGVGLLFVGRGVNARRSNS